MKLIFGCLFINFLFGINSASLSCKNENDENIDWFIGLKYPMSFNFVYLSSDSTDIGWRTPKFDLSNEANLIGLTLAQTYTSKQTDSFYAFYNDEKPESEENYATRGHLKGVVAFDRSSGLWLVHSVPKFPSEDAYKYGQKQTDYGQSFICVSLPFGSLKSIASQLIMMQATVYSSNLPGDFSTDSEMNTLLTAFINNENKPSDRNRTIPLKTLNNLSLLHFGKSRQFGKDLYADLVAPLIKSSIFVESWIRGEKINSSCNLYYKVYNVKKVRLIDATFTESHDHSKWVVSKNSNVPVICIGDINRMTSQCKRGGGTLCISNNKIWEIFSLLVNQYEKCDNTLLSVLPETKYDE